MDFDDGEYLWGRHEHESAEELDLLRILDPSDSGGGMGNQQLSASVPREDKHTKGLSRSSSFRGPSKNSMSSQIPASKPLVIDEEPTPVHSHHPAFYAPHVPWGASYDPRQPHVMYQGMPPPLPHRPPPPPRSNPTVAAMWHQSNPEKVTRAPAPTRGQQEDLQTVPSVAHSKSLSSLSNFVKSDESIQDLDVDVDEDASDFGSAEGLSSRGTKKRRGGSGASVEHDADQMTKERNREHARNTRLRKKAYVAKLSQLVVELKAEKEAEERLEAAQSLRTKKRAALLQEFLALRGNGESDPLRWRRVLDESCTLTLPITPYRSFRHCEILHATRVLRGVESVVGDARSLKVCLEHIGSHSSAWKRCRTRGVRVGAAFDVSGDIVSSGDSAMARWVLSTSNAAECGALCDVKLRGMLRCSFAPSPAPELVGGAGAGSKPLAVEFNGGGAERILSCEFVFDVMTFMQQLLMASGPEPSPALSHGNIPPSPGKHNNDSGASRVCGGEGEVTVDEVPVVPNTLDMARLPSRHAGCIAEVAHPFRVAHLNSTWTQRRGCTEAESVGRPSTVMQHLLELEQRSQPRGQGHGKELRVPGGGKERDEEEDGLQLLNDVRMGRTGSACLIVKEDQIFVRAFPLTSHPGSREITHLLLELVS